MTRILRSPLAMSAVLTAALAVLGAPAHAQKKGGNVITIGEVTIVGRVQKPKLTLAELRQPFLTRIEDAVGRDPF